MVNEHSNGSFTSTVVAVRLSHGRDADSSSHVPKTRGRTDEEFRRRNLRKIPLALLIAACYKLILLTHSTKIIFLPLFHCFLPQHFLLSIRNAYALPIALYRRLPKQPKTFIAQQPYEYFWTALFGEIFPGGSPQKRVLRSLLLRNLRRNTCATKSLQLHWYSACENNSIFTAIHSITHTAHSTQSTPRSIMLPTDSRHNPECAEASTIHASSSNTFRKCKESLSHSILIESYLRRTCTIRDENSTDPVKQQNHSKNSCQYQQQRDRRHWGVGLWLRNWRKQRSQSRKNDCPRVFQHDTTSDTHSRRYSAIVNRSLAGSPTVPGRFVKTQRTVVSQKWDTIC